MSDRSPEDRTPHAEDGASDHDPGVDLEVRALLADARATAPMPADVAARLDDVLAGLVAQRNQDSPSSEATPDDVPTMPVADLAAARGRRHRRTWLGAAAAAVVLVAGGVALPGLLAGDDTDSATVSAEDRAGAPPEAAAPSPLRDGEADGQRSEAWDSDRLPMAQSAQPLTLSRAGLRSEVEAHLADPATRLAAPHPAPGDAAADAEQARPRGARKRRSMAAYASPGPCPWPGRGTQEPATLDGEPATLVTRTTAAGTVVRVVTCVEGASTVAERLVLDADR